MTALPVEEARKLVEQAAGDPDAIETDRCSCGAPKAEHSGPKQTGGCTTTLCRRYRPDLAHALAARAMTADRAAAIDDLEAGFARLYPRPKPADDGWSVGPSDAGTCRRQIWYREMHAKGLLPDLHLDPVNTAAATLGSMWHDALTRARSMLYPWRRFEQPVTLPGFDRTGRYDEFDPITGVLTDCKSKGDRGWERLGEYGPDPDVWAQLLIYGYALSLTGETVNTLRVLFLHRAGDEEEVFERPYDHDEAEEAVGRLHAVLVALDMGADLPRDRSGPTSDPLCREFCPFKSACWNIPAAEAAGRSPESYTILGSDPAAEEIEYAASVVNGWNEAKREAKREHADALPLLTGVPEGTYGRYQVRERRRTMPDYKRYWELLQEAHREYLAAPPEFRGDFAEWAEKIPVPRRVDRWVEVRTVRAVHTDPTGRPRAAADTERTP